MTATLQHRDDGQDHHRDEHEQRQPEEDPPHDGDAVAGRTFGVQHVRLTGASRRGGKQRATHDRPHHAGPTGAEKSPSAITYPCSSTANGSWGRGRAAGPWTGRAPSRASKADW